MSFDESVTVEAGEARRRARYGEVLERIEALLDGEGDWTAAMATVVSELHHAFDYFDWTGFYRRIEPQLLAVGPYQGTHGCLRIPFERGICGAAARTRETQLVDDVEAREDHIACSSSTRSEVVVPVLTAEDEVLAVLDVDSDAAAAFSEVDRQYLERLAEMLGRRYGEPRLG